MSRAEEDFMLAKERMQSAIADFYTASQEIGIDDEGFAEDINEAVGEASDQAVVFEDWDG